MNFLKADAIFDGEKIHLDKVLAYEADGTVQGILSPLEMDYVNVQKKEGILCPGLINSHCHLELSHLYEKIKPGTGIVDFILSIQQFRNDNNEIIKAAMYKADQCMYEQGIVAVGDISNSTQSIQSKTLSKIRYHTFIELLGLNPENAEHSLTIGNSYLAAFEEANLTASLAPHAPYSTSNALISSILNLKRISSIHFQESIAESQFINSKLGDFIRLFEHFQIDISYFNPISEALERYISTLKTSSSPLLLVHNTFTDASYHFPESFFYCFCPKANLYIESQLPNPKMICKNIHKALVGTDSLASNDSLDLISELYLLQEHAALEVADLLAMATKNAACFFGWKDLGCFKKGTKPGITLIKNIKDLKLTSKSYSIKMA